MNDAVHERYKFKPFPGSSHSWALGHITALPAGVKFLDIGPGNGDMGRILKERGAARACAVETDAEARQRIAPIYDQVEADLERFGSEKFDLVLLLDVMEHMADPSVFFKRAMERLSPGGKVLVSVPNVAHWSVRIPLLLGFFKYTSRGILDRTHLQFFTRCRFRQLLTSVPGVEIAEVSSSIEPAEFVLPRAIWDSAAFRLLSKLRLATARTLPGFFAYQHLAVLKRSGA